MILSRIQRSAISSPAIARLPHALLTAAALFLVASFAQPVESRAAGAESILLPTFAYYYIWFDPTSWERAKTDYPVLGRYSSDDIEVMRQHIQWAKDSGIDGFIVSWKSTPKLNPRLEQLIGVAAEEQFKLAIIYQGLDFWREPLPIDRIAEDLDYFAYRWADHEVFDLYQRPVVIWSGTWKFTEHEIDIVTSGLRDRLLILGSERNLDGYLRIADLVDGNAYYWSSVDPETFPGYPEKLGGMSQAVHEHGGIWIAPAAPGFDARLIGGTRVVERKDGTTLRRQIEVALGSAPDIIGLISWNEFSENTHLEPSRTHGGRYLEILADVLGSEFILVGDFDSSAPAATGASNGIPTLLVTVGVILGSLLVVAWRESHRGGNRGETVDDRQPGTIDGGP